MTIKKTFVTSTCLIFSTFLLMQAYTFKKDISESNTINYSALINLTQNINDISSGSSIKDNSNEETVVTNEIISVINKEISGEIKKSKYKLSMVKAAKKKIQYKALAINEVKKTIEQKSSVDLSVFEINNSELINLHGYSIDNTSYKKFESIQLADTYNEVNPKNDIVSDTVAVKQASTYETNMDTQEVEANNQEIADKPESEEMVMFDYSKQDSKEKMPKTIDQKLYERPLSKTVQNAINREIGSAPIKKLEAVNIQNKFESKFENKTNSIDSVNDADETTTYEYSKPEPKKKSNESEAFTGSPNSEIEESIFVLSAKEINLSTQKNKQAIAFEFVPDYDRAERKDDQGSGEIQFGYSLNGTMNTQTGVVQAQGMISTRTELNLAGKASLEIPLINEEGMQKFLQKIGLSIEGNLILLAIDNSIVDAEIDSRFAAKLYFDKNFKNLNGPTGASYMMFAGVKNGNIMLRYLLTNKEVAQKIIYVGDGEMYFEDAEFANSYRETYTLTTRNLMSQKRNELVIDGGAISFFNTNITAKKKALNAYDIKIPVQPSGMRKYLEFKHLKDSIFVGTATENNIEIPSNDFISKVLEMNQVSSLKDRCVVQVNLAKDVREIKVNGKNRSGEMFVETSYLDSEGNFSKDSADMAEKLFIVGDLEGQLNLKLDYTDGSTEFVKTFCSEGTYLVEQL